MEKVELVKWHKARDCLLEQDVYETLRLAKDCEHEDAKWLVSL